jgi:hypothetical protein
MMRKLGVALVVVCVAALAVAVPALAFDCTVAKKPSGAGSAGTLTSTGFIPNKPNPGTFDQIHGGFINFGDGDTFVHAHKEVLPPVLNGVQNLCDGKGLDSIEGC